MNNNKLKIFISAYACEPGLGSEIGVGWHWVLEMSKYFELWVLTRESNRHTIEPWIAEHPEYAGIHFLYFDLPKWARWWKKGLRGVRTYYNIWQVCTNRIVRRTMQENGIRVFHHLTYGNVLWKVSSYGQRQFFVWGPVGGLETVPEEFSRHYTGVWRFVEALRRAVVKTIPLNFGLKQRCRNADLILCKTDITRHLLPAEYRHKAVLQTDVAVETEPTTQTEKCVSDTNTLRLVTVGRLEGWRGFDLCLEALALAAVKNRNIHLTIVGDGKERARLEQMTEKLGIQSLVTFTGFVSAAEYHRLLNESDVVLNGSLKEGAVTVSFDSMAAGKPLVCLDTTGYTRYFKDDYAVVIPITSRSEVIKRMADGILRLQDRDLRERMGQKAIAAGREFTWERRGEEICRLFTDRLNG
jgi:glycosyltransferase involved in cell wall biosynthesis